MKELKFIHISKCAGTTIENLGKENNITWGKYDKKTCGHHHIPLSNKPDVLKKKYDWFMVVRNPYHRLISEFYCKWSGYRGVIDNCTTKQFNEFLKKKILDRGIKTRYHYLEQSKYLDKNIKIHIIKFEQLEDEFNNLMRIYNLNLKLSRHDNARNPDFCKFSVKSFTPELIKLINTVYHNDFLEFGYKKINI